MRSIAYAIALLGLALFAPAQSLHAANFIVNNAGSQGDDDASVPMTADDNVCDIDVNTAGLQCTLRAAIQEANDQTATAASPHMITFDGPTSITLTVGLDTLTAPANINGAVTNAATGGRLELDGNDLGCFQLAETDTSPINATGARGSTIQNFVIRNCGSFGGIGLSGHGYTISGNRIGTNGAGTASSTMTDSNSGYGISVTGTITPPSLPDISAIIADPPANFGAIAAFVTSLSAALTAIANPTTITGNLVSGNQTDGIVLTNPMTVNVLISGNIVGLDQSTTIALPNGHGGGSFAGIRLGNGVYGNIVGPANIVSGQTTAGDDGIVVETGEVLLPNFIMGNLVGLGNNPIFDLGNSQSGIRVDTRPDTTGPSVNPTGFALFIGPANTISDNQGANNGDPDGTADNDGGIVVGESDGVRIYGNQIGAFAFPAGGTPIGNLDVGNAGNGIIVTDTTAPPGVVQIGGSEAFEANFILRNGKHGINVRGAEATRIVIQNNFIGVLPDGLDVFDFANGVDGIHLDSTGSMQIGGTGEFEDNVIAGNGRHGIALRNGNLTLGWANHIQRNQIYANTGLGVDLDVAEDLPDATDDTPDQDPNDTFYANWGQNTPVLTGIDGAVQYTFESAPNRMYRLDVYQDDSAGVTASSAEARTWISETTITTDGNGDFAGSLPAPAGGGFVTVMATDISPAADVPGPTVAGPHNNTSEISNGLELIEYSVNDPSVVETNAGTTTLTFVVSRTGSNSAIGSVDVVTADNTATTGDSDYVAVAMQTIDFAIGQATANVQVTVNGDARFELDETLFLNLSNPVNGTIADAQGIGTITNDDAQPTLSIGDVTLAEGTGGASTPFVFTVTLSAPSSQTVTVDAQSAVGGATPATAGTDYTALAATPLTFVPGDTSETVTVQVTHDPDVEGNETFLVNLTNATNATTLDAQGLGTITNDDGLATPDVSIGDVTLAEGTGGATTAFSFTVTLSAMSASPVTVDYATANGTATTADADYVAETASIQIDAGMTSGQITIDVNHDAKFEANETFLVNLTAATGGNVTDNQATGTINNDDTAPTLAVSDPTVAEGNAGTTQLAFVVSLSAASGVAASVNAASADGTATTADADYVALASTPVSFPPGTVQQTVNVTVNGDTKFEADETVLLDLAGAAGATIADPQGSGTITNDDNPPTLSIADRMLPEGNAGNTAFDFTATLSNPSAFPMQFDYTLQEGTATLADNDYVDSSGTIVFAPGDTSEPVVVQVVGDTTDEPDETFTISATTASQLASAKGLASQATGTILNDDGATGEFSITDVTLAEGNAGTTNFVFQVTRSSTVGTASVSVQSADGSATVADGDYVALPATVVNFAAGDASEDVTVTVNGDVTFENDEGFTLTLAAPVGGTILDGTGAGTISNDDASPGATAAPVSLPEGNAGNTPFTFTLTLTAPSAIPLSVTVQTIDGTATVAGNDYVALPPTVVNFAPGDTSEPVVVDVVGDTDVEADETFTLAISTPQPTMAPVAAAAKLALGGSSATGTILNDDAVAGEFSIGDVTLAEGNAGTASFVFQVTRSTTAGTASVTVQSADGSATIGDADYVALPATVVSFAAGDASEDVTVTVNGDATVEPDETFTLSLSAPANGTILDGTGVGTIVNDDTVAPSFAIDDVTQAEGNAGTTAFTFTVTRGGDTTGAASVTAQSAVGGGTPGSGAGVDFIDLAATVVNFAAGATSASVTVQVVGDTVFEPSDTFVVDLSNPGSGTITDAQGIGTITNDDAQPTVSIADLTLAEGNAGTTSFTLVLTLSNASSLPVSVTLATGGGSATAPGDYAALTSVVVTFPPGSTTQTVTLAVVGDTAAEGDETVTVTLSAPANATILDGTAIVTIVDDDAGAAPAAPLPVPALAPWLLALLALLTGVAGAAMLRVRSAR